MKSTSRLLALVVSRIVGLRGRTDAFDSNAHKRLSEKAAEASTEMVPALRLLGTQFAEGLATPLPGGTVEAHIANGAIQEDNPIERVIFHFHDPDEPWDQAGLTVYPASVIPQ